MPGKRDKRRRRAKRQSRKKQEQNIKKWWQFQMTKKDKYWIGAVILIIVIFYLDWIADDNKIIEVVAGLLSLLFFILIFTWIFKGIRKNKGN